MTLPHDPEPGTEVRLDGGTANRGLVVRVDGTVRRPQTPSSPAVHALLRHLEAAGFDGAPRYLGEDAAGREVLTYVEGDVPIRPVPAWALTDRALVSVAELLRRFHDAVRGFDPTPWRWGTSVPDRYRSGLVTHNDPNLDNVVFKDGRAVALIDFDLAAPGCVAWELAAAARLWVPLQDPRDVPQAVAGRVLERLRLFADAYGLTTDERREVVLAVGPSHHWGYGIVREGAGTGHAGYADYWRESQDRFARGDRWVEDNLDLLLGAVLGD